MVAHQLKSIKKDNNDEQLQSKSTLANFKRIGKNVKTQEDLFSLSFILVKMPVEAFLSAGRKPIYTCQTP